MCPTHAKKVQSGTFCMFHFLFRCLPGFCTASFRAKHLLCATLIRYSSSLIVERTPRLQPWEPSWHVELENLQDEYSFKADKVLRVDKESEWVNCAVFCRYVDLYTCTYLAFDCTSLIDHSLANPS